jgi:hypothetical protein
MDHVSREVHMKNAYKMLVWKHYVKYKGARKDYLFVPRSQQEINLR